MEDILSQHSPQMTPENTGEKELFSHIIPNKPEKILDLHELFLRDALTAAEDFLQECQYERVIKSQIITGQGEVLRPEIGHFLRNKQNFYDIKTITEHPGSFDLLFHL